MRPETRAGHLVCPARLTGGPEVVPDHLLDAVRLESAHPVV